MCCEDITGPASYWEAAAAAEWRENGRVITGRERKDGWSHSTQWHAAHQQQGFNLLGGGFNLQPFWRLKISLERCNLPYCLGSLMKWGPLASTPVIPPWKWSPGGCVPEQSWELHTWGPSYSIPLFHLLAIPDHFSHTTSPGKDGKLAIPDHFSYTISPGKDGKPLPFLITSPTPPVQARMVH